jgi:carboxypeptidase PM20D1
MPRGRQRDLRVATILANIEAYAFPVKINDVTRRYFELSRHSLRSPSALQCATSLRIPSYQKRRICWRNPGAGRCDPDDLCRHDAEAGHAENALPQSATATVELPYFPR